MREILKKYLFCNIGWMHSYEGNTSADPIIGGGSSDIKFEVCNFVPWDGQFYGYVQPPGPGDALMRRITIEDIAGRAASAQSICERGVFVIWTAPRPKVGTVVVGWYKNATIYREFQEFQTIPQSHRNYSILGYRISAKVSESKLLPIDERTISVPRARQGAKCVIGQSNVCFDKSQKGLALANQVWKLANQKHEKPKKQWSAKVDAEHNKKVEKAAIKAATQYYKNLGYAVESVESENKGWDLEAVSGKIMLRIEVKGLSGLTPIASLSAREYKAFGKQNRNYRLAIVTNALENPTMWICYYHNEANDWKVMNTDYSVGVIERAEVRIKTKE